MRGHGVAGNRHDLCHMECMDVKGRIPYKNLISKIDNL